MFSFEYYGGSIGDDKLHCFMVPPSGGEEIHVSEALKRRYIELASGVAPMGVRRDAYYQTPSRFLKIFVSQMIHGMKTPQSFYLELLNDESMPTVNIHLVDGLHGFYFRGRARFLKKAEVLDLLDPKSVSRAIYLRQKTYAVDFLRKLIKIERPVFKVKGRRLAIPKIKKAED